MSQAKPDHHDADIVMKLYDLRREAVMRASRDAIARFMPQSYEEFVAVTKPEHPLNAAYRQTASYWEMVFGMAKHQIVNAEYLVENNGEGILLFSKVAPYVARYREEVWPLAFRHAEWAATQTDIGKRLLERFQAWLQPASKS